MMIITSPNADAQGITMINHIKKGIGSFQNKVKKKENIF